MTQNEIVFNEDLEMYITLEGLEIRLVLSDSLYAADEVLTTEYKNKIVNFINNSSKWYLKSIEVIKKRAKDTYQISSLNKEDISLMTIFILFEQNEDELFGLGFRTSFDLEHGCGLKLKGNNYSVTEVGTWDVAFS